MSSSQHSISNIDANLLEKWYVYYVVSYDYCLHFKLLIVPSDLFLNVLAERNSICAYTKNSITSVMQWHFFVTFEIVWLDFSVVEVGPFWQTCFLLMKSDSTTLTVIPKSTIGPFRQPHRYALVTYSIMWSVQSTKSIAPPLQNASDITPLPFQMLLMQEGSKNQNAAPATATRQHSDRYGIKFCKLHRTYTILFI